jgi:uncharacterized protein DUF6496
LRIRISLVPAQSTTKRARRAARAGKAPSTQAGEFVREEIDAIRAGEHGARSAKQAIAIGLSKARRAGVKLPAPKRGKARASIRRKAAQDLAAGRRTKANRGKSRLRSAASLNALKREGRAAASHTALSRQAHASARRRTAAERSAAAQRAARTRRKPAKGK